MKIAVCRTRIDRYLWNVPAVNRFAAYIYILWAAESTISLFDNDGSHSIDLAARGLFHYSFYLQAISLQLSTAVISYTRSSIAWEFMLRWDPYRSQVVPVELCLLLYSQWCVITCVTLLFLSAMCVHELVIWMYLAARVSLLNTSIGGAVYSTLETISVLLLAASGAFSVVRLRNGLAHDSIFL